MGAKKLMAKWTGPAAVWMTAAGVAVAQTSEAAPAPGDGNNMPIIVAVAVVGAMAIGGGVWLLTRQSRPAAWSPEIIHDAPSSKFEQITAEIQGLSLRVAGGESKGYYRKIDRLARVFMERVGCGLCTKMDDDELKKALKCDALKGDESTVLTSIFDRCEKGAQNEREALDFTAGELLKELWKLVAVAEGAAQKSRNALKEK